MAAIDILISAKNATGKAIEGAKGGILGLAQSFLHSKASIVAAWGIVVNKVAQGAHQLISLYDADEKAVRKLAVTHQLFGENAARYVTAEKNIASAIQDEIGKGDEATIALMSRLRLYGVMPAALGDAAKATYALAAAGMGEEQASRAVALAMQGNYTMLNRYIPALRDAQTEEEKRAAFQKTIEVGYQMAREELNSYSGSIVNLKGRMGDLGEVMGQVLNWNNWVGKSITAAADGVKYLTSAISEAVNGKAEIPTTLDGEEWDREQAALKEVYQLNKQLVIAKRDLVKLSEAQAQLKADEAALPALKEQAALLKEQLKLRKGILAANAKEQVNEVKARKRKEKEAEKLERANKRMMDDGQRVWVNLQHGAGKRAIEAAKKGDWDAVKRLGGLTENQLAKLEVYLQRAKAQAEINPLGFNPNGVIGQRKRDQELQKLGADKNLIWEGLDPMEKRARDHIAVTQENIENAKTEIDSYGASVAEMKANIAKIEKALQTAKMQSNLYQKDIAHHTERMASETADMKVYVEQANEILCGVETYLRSSLEAS